MTNYLGETSVRSDVSLFLSRFRPDASANFTLTSIASGPDSQTPNTTSLSAGKNLEGNLDAETILGIVFPTPMEVYNTGGSPPFVPDLATPTNTNEPYLDWLQFMLGLETVPQVISTSYGDDEQTVPLSYATAVCNGFARLGARGVSLLFASGDNGVGSNGECVSNDGRNTSMFLPIFPGSCVSSPLILPLPFSNHRITFLETHENFQAIRNNSRRYNANQPRSRRVQPCE